VIRRDSPSDIAVGVALAWALRVATGVPEASDWACGGAAVLVARRSLLEGRPLPPAAQIRAERILGRASVAAQNMQEFSDQLPPRARWALAGTADVGELWQAEFRWWSLWSVMDSSYFGVPASVLARRSARLRCSPRTRGDAAPPGDRRRRWQVDGGYDAVA